MSGNMSSARRALVLAAIVALLLMPLSALAQAPSFEVIASGLNSPRGLAFAPNGKLVVAEVGSGNNDGAITGIDVKTGARAAIIENLPSQVSPQGDPVGVHDVAFVGRINILAPIGLGDNPATRPAGSRTGWLLRASATGKVQARADVAGHESSANPDGGEVDSNPYAVQVLPDGSAVVADAGANAVLRVNVATGAVQTLAVFPARNVAAPFPPFSLPAESVPDAIALGPDGALYVGELLGFPFTPGESRIYRVQMDGSYDVFAEGFTAIIDITFDAQGNMFVLEVAKNGLLAAFDTGDWTGALIKVTPNGTRTEVASQGLFAPGGVAIGPDGAAYVTNYGIVPGGGQVVKIPLP